MKKNDKLLLYLLIFANIVSSLFAFLTALGKHFNDGPKYLSLAESLKFGKYSMWYFLPDYYPETLRTPGYPLFIFSVKSVFGNDISILIAQYLLYLLSLYLCCKIVLKITGNIHILFIFLFLTVFNIQIPFYSGYLSAEMLTIFLTVLYFYILICLKYSFKNAILLGIVAGADYLVRPSFLLFPLLLIYTLWIIRKKEYLRYYFVHLITLFLCTVPFSIWNLKNHGVYKPTPLESGAGLMHMSYWSFKLPFGYKETFNWDNVIVKDATSPFGNAVRNKKYIQIYENQWKELITACDSLQSNKDRENLDVMKNSRKPLFITYNSKYTLKKEKMLREYTLQEIKKNPFFYLETRIYTFMRFYFTGFNENAFNNSKSFLGKVNAVYPFIVTFSTIFLGLFLSLIYLLRYRFFKNTYLIILTSFCLYVGLAHLFFTIASRYTVPAHFFILILFSIYLYKVYGKRLISDKL